jgi:hypothetical protein
MYAITSAKIKYNDPCTNKLEIQKPRRSERNIAIPAAKEYNT